jgi:hypothetical protein
MVLQALEDCIYDDACNYATRWLAELPHVIWGSKDSSQLFYGILALLSDLRIRSCIGYRRRLWSSTDPVL